MDDKHRDGLVLDPFGDVGVSLFLPVGIHGWDVAASKGALFDESRQLSKLIGRPTTLLATSVKAAIG